MRHLKLTDACCGYLQVCGRDGTHRVEAAVPGAHSWTLLMCAASSGCVEVVSFLLEAGVNGLCLYYSCYFDMDFQPRAIGHGQLSLSSRPVNATMYFLSCSA